VLAALDQKLAVVDPPSARLPESNAHRIPDPNAPLTQFPHHADGSNRAILDVERGGLNLAAG
jgi:hypothetical protein